MVPLRDRHWVNNAASVVICGALAGLVLAAAAFPALAVTGLAAKVGADSFQELPADLEVLPPPETSYLYAADGKTRITGFYEENRQNVSLDDIAPVMRDAMVAAEDNRFYDHHGVDLKGVMRAIVANSRAGEVTQGASTLTMQYVRQALTYSARTPEERRAATADTPGRKLKEIRYAIALEKRLSKDQILENYLNIAYFGHKAYGIYAASYAYFSKHPRELQLEEAALLAATVQAPSVYDPSSSNRKNREAILNRRNWVLDRMAGLGFVTPDQAEKGKNTKVELDRKVPPNSCVDVPRKHRDWGFFCAYFVEWWKQQKAFGANPEEREANLKSGGYKIVTTLEPKLQNSAMKHILQRKNVRSNYALGGVFIEPGTGRVKAMAVNRNYSNDRSNNGPHSDPAAKRKGTYPNTTNLVLGGGELGYQAGSTFKMFTMLASLKEGMPLATAFQSPHQYRSQYVGGSAGDAAACRVGGVYHWCPKNANKRMAGLRNMWSGFGMSVNTYFVQLEEAVGAERAVAMAEELGLTWHNPLDADYAAVGGPHEPKNWGSFTLGTPETTPLEMANAYATVAADGKYCDPLPVKKIFDRSGAELSDIKPTCEQRIAPEVARAATDAARCPVGEKPQGAGASCGSWGTAHSVGATVRQPVAGKTGTTDNNQAAWFVGYTRNLAGAVFQADPDYRKRTVYSPNDSIQVFSNSVRDYLGNRHLPNFPAPPVKLARGDMAPVPGVSCKSVATATETLEDAGFKVRENPTQVPSRCAKGTVAYTKPSGKAPRNSYVTLFLSNGTAPKPSAPPDPEKPNKKRPPHEEPEEPPPPPDDDRRCKPHDDCWPPRDDDTDGDADGGT